MASQHLYTVASATMPQVQYQQCVVCLRARTVTRTDDPSNRRVPDFIWQRRLNAARGVTRGGRGRLFPGYMSVASTPSSFRNSFSVAFP